jgi:hypothetical protein
VKGGADADIVVFFNGISDLQTFLSKRSSVLLENSERSALRFPNWQGHLDIDKQTEFSRKFLLDDEELDVLPAFAAVNVGECKDPT